MLPQRLEDIERDKPYACYQLEVRVQGTWRSRTIYACPIERFHLLLAKLPMHENMRFRRVHTAKADMAMITDSMIVTVIP